MTCRRPFGHRAARVAGLAAALCLVIAGRAGADPLRCQRAILKATNMCATEPERAARILVDQEISKSYEYTLQALKDLPYNRWRELDPTDAVRFWSLRLHEAGLIKSGPNKIIAQGTDWRFFNELKKELKG